MRRLIHWIGTLMLLVTLWTATTAHAAEAFGCNDVSASSSGHFDGDGDEVPGDADKAVPHHHGGCSGHHSGVPTGADTVQLAVSELEAVTIAYSKGLYGREPNRALRPPIA